MQKDTNLLTDASYLRRLHLTSTASLAILPLLKKHIVSQTIEFSFILLASYVPPLSFLSVEQTNLQRSKRISQLDKGFSL
jgi:dolichol kinase